MSGGTTEACVLCGPVAADGRSQPTYTSGYQCAGGSTTVVGDGKTICPAGTVDYKICDWPSHIYPGGCPKKGTTACTKCPAGQYQDQEGTVKTINHRPLSDALWYNKVFFFFFFSFPACSRSFKVSLFLIYFFNY